MKEYAVPLPNKTHMFHLLKVTRPNRMKLYAETQVQRKLFHWTNDLEPLKDINFVSIKSVYRLIQSAHFFGMISQSIIINR
jgi:hypothetical protein